jgi:dGTPase
MRMANKAKRFIQELFKVYIDKPEQLPPQIQKRISIDGTRRMVCDYIAGMTDRYALDEYKKLFDPYEKV